MSEELTVEDARAELERIKAWLNSLAEMQKQQQQIVIRAGFLQGFLTGKEDPAVTAVPDAESPDPTPPAPSKRTTPKRKVG